MCDFVLFAELARKLAEYCWTEFAQSNRFLFCFYFVIKSNRSCQMLCVLVPGWMREDRRSVWWKTKWFCWYLCTYTFTFMVFCFKYTLSMNYCDKLVSKTNSLFYISISFTNFNLKLPLPRPMRAHIFVLHQNVQNCKDHNVVFSILLFNNYIYIFIYIPVLLSVLYYPFRLPRNALRTAQIQITYGTPHTDRKLFFIKFKIHTRVDKNYTLL